MWLSSSSKDTSCLHHCLPEKEKRKTDRQGRHTSGNLHPCLHLPFARFAVVVTFQAVLFSPRGISVSLPSVHAVCVSVPCPFPNRGSFRTRKEESRSPKSNRSPRSHLPLYLSSSHSCLYLYLPSLKQTFISYSWALLALAKLSAQPLSTSITACLPSCLSSLCHLHPSVGTLEERRRRISLSLLPLSSPSHRDKTLTDRRTLVLFINSF